MSKLPKWTDVYPQGTKEGNEEQRFFIALARHPKYSWRSTSSISQETGLSKDRVEQIVDKYWRLGIVLQHPNRDDHWGYWENNKDSLPVVQKGIKEEDQDKRIKKILKK